MGEVQGDGDLAGVYYLVDTDQPFPDVCNLDDCTYKKEGNGDEKFCFKASTKYESTCSASGSAEPSAEPGAEPTGEPSAETTTDSGCILTKDTLEYSCQKEKVNFLARENAEVFPGTESWKCCSQLCLDSDTCKFWAWSNKGNKGNCALMTGYGSEAANNNVISGPKICPDE